MLVTPLNHLDALGTSLDIDSSHLVDEQLDALAGDLAALVCPTTWRVWPAHTLAAVKTDSQACRLPAERYYLPNGYSFPADAQLSADLDRLIADLQKALRRVQRDRWLARVVALPT